jgi:hypothetical protein
VKILLKLLSAIALTAGSACGQIVFSEIHYHPVEVPAFLTDGAPVMDLSQPAHEFVEVQNAGAAAVDLSGWTISGGVDFAFPTGTVLGPGAVVAVAKDPAALTLASQPPSPVLGPYAGKLSNRGEQLRLRDADGNPRDQVRYSASFPWPDTANALGAQPRFTGFDAAEYRYHGRSLQRVSATSPGNDPANWMASPANEKPSPGVPQILLRTPPKPIVIGLSIVQASDGAGIVRANEPAKLTVSFSAPNSLSAVTVEYFVDQVESFAETHQTLAMADAGGDIFTATLPGFPDRSVVRYRLRANRGNGVEIVSPREDDAKIAPVGAGGALEAWHGYFVTPARPDTVPAYDVFISNAALDALNKNISQTPRRVTQADVAGQPREVPYVAATAPQWNGTQPAVFCADGQVWDVQLRYHGGFTQRSATRDSYKIHFPDSHPFRGVTSLFETDKDWHVAEGEALVAAAGLPAPATRSVNLYLNNRPGLPRLEVGEYNGELLEAFHRQQQRLDPNHRFSRAGTDELRGAGQATTPL